MRRMMVDTLGYDFTEDRLDCIMATMFTNRTLPDILYYYRRDGGEARDERYDARYGQDRLCRLFYYVSCWFMFPLVHDNALYSRLEMGPLCGEILYHIKSTLAATGTTETGVTPKMARNTTTGCSFICTKYVKS